jgi:hypothetical protein
MEAMNKAQKQKQDWMTQDHGKYTEIVDEKEFSCCSMILATWANWFCSAS